MTNYIIEIKDPSKIFFTSDLHFGHRNIINFCNRPFKDVDEMNQKLIENWNNTVPKDGIVFDLGDFCFGNNSAWKRVLTSLNGEHHLILGNHDVTRYPGHQIMEMFNSVNYQLYLHIENRYVYLNHYPFLCYGGSYKKPEHAVIQLFGHVHSGPRIDGRDKDRLKYLFPYQYDVGVDNNNYKPISWEQIKEIINKQIKSHELIKKIDEELDKKELNKKVYEELYKIINEKLEEYNSKEDTTVKFYDEPFEDNNSHEWMEHWP